VVEAAEQSEAGPGPAGVRQAHALGEGNGIVVLMYHCYRCHPGGEAGLAPSINDKPLPAFVIKTQVRLGVGAMPRFSKEEITGPQLDDLVKYLQALRCHQ
jgi:mono/diheme cytochrome c family protein